MYNHLFEVPAWSMVSNPYYYKSRNSDRLLITVGDSWTYGDSLGNTKVRLGRDDTEHRLEHIYGNVLSNTLNCDWINLALPGISNLRMLDWLEKLLEQNFSQNITVITTLTESGRHEELNLLNPVYSTQQFALTQILAYTYNKINNFKLKFSNVKFITAHNFTDGASGLIELCERNWLEVLTDTIIQKNTHIVVSEHIEQMNYSRRFPDVLEIIDRANQRIEILDNCQYCNSGDTRHPTEEGHVMWANYILRYL